MLVWFIGLQAFLRCVVVSGRDLFFTFKFSNCHPDEENASYKAEHDSGVYRNNG